MPSRRRDSRCPVPGCKKKRHSTARKVQSWCLDHYREYQKRYMSGYRAAGLDLTKARINSRPYRFDLKRRLMAHLGATGCSHCDFVPQTLYDYAAIDFHHRDHTTKLFALSSAHGRAWRSLVAEVEKCDVLCANCHRIHHATHGLPGVGRPRVARPPSEE